MEEKIRGGQGEIDQHDAQEVVVKAHIVFAAGNVIEAVDVKHQNPHCEKQRKRHEVLLPDDRRRHPLVTDGQGQVKGNVEKENIARKQHQFFESA